MGRFLCLFGVQHVHRLFFFCHRKRSTCGGYSTDTGILGMGLYIGTGIVIKREFRDNVNDDDDDELDIKAGELSCFVLMLAARRRLYHTDWHMLTAPLRRPSPHLYRKNPFDFTPFDLRIPPTTRSNSTRQLSPQQRRRLGGHRRVFSSCSSIGSYPAVFHGRSFTTYRTAYSFRA